MNCDELIVMEIDDLLEYLERKGDTDHGFDRKSSLQDVRDYIIDNYEFNCTALHSECQDTDYSPMHPDETVDDFEDHEDHEPRD